MKTGKYELVIKWPSGQGTLCGEISDDQYGEVCRILSPDYPAKTSPNIESQMWPYAPGIAEDLERSDWTPEEALRWYAAGKHFDTFDNRTRIIDTGAIASNALKHASLQHLELKGDAELSELRAELSAIKGGGEAAAEVSAETFSSDGTSDIITRNLPIGTKLYTHPPVVAEAEPVGRNWTEDFEHENGEYTRLCRECHNEFIGYKRRTICKACADTAPPASGAVPVPRELLGRLAENLRGTSIDRPFPTGTYKLLTELRALLAKEVV